MSEFKDMRKQWAEDTDPDSEPVAKIVKTEDLPEYGLKWLENVREQKIAEIQQQIGGATTGWINGDFFCANLDLMSASAFPKNHLPKAKALPKFKERKVDPVPEETPKPARRMRIDFSKKD